MAEFELMAKELQIMQFALWVGLAAAVPNAVLFTP